MTNVDFRTEKEKQRDAEYDRIAARYVEYRTMYPVEVVSDNKVFGKIAAEYGRTIPSVRTICFNAGVAGATKK